MSEVLGLTKSKSIDGDYILVKKVVVHAGSKIVRHFQGKVSARNRCHRIPPYIKQRIDLVDGDVLVPLNSRKIYYRFPKLLKDSGLPHMPFHGFCSQYVKPKTRLLFFFQRFNFSMLSIKWHSRGKRISSCFFRYFSYSPCALSKACLWVTVPFVVKISLLVIFR